MSDPRLSRVLTPARLTALRLISTGETRRNGMPWEPQRQQLEWLDREGYVKLGPAPEPTTRDRMLKVRRTVEVTAKGWAVLGVVAGEIPADDYGPRRIGYVVGVDDGKCILYPTEREAVIAANERQP